MAAMQEAAVTCDVLQSGGEYHCGLDHFARSAAWPPQNNTKLRYDYAAFVNPWAAPLSGHDESSPGER